MDAFTERQILDTLKLISGSLIGIKAELADLNIAVRELGENLASENSRDDEDNENGEESEIGFDDPTVKFEVSEVSLEDEEEESSEGSEGNEGREGEISEDTESEYDGKIHFKDDSFDR
jgi:hypothetical protein